MRYSQRSAEVKLIPKSLPSKSPTSRVFPKGAREAVRSLMVTGVQEKLRVSTVWE